MLSYLTVRIGSGNIKSPVTGSKATIEDPFRFVHGRKDKSTIEKSTENRVH